MVALARVRRTAPQVPSAARREEPWLAGALTWALVLCWVGTICVVVLSASAALGPGRPTWWGVAIAIVLIVVSVEPVRRWVRRGVEDVVYSHHDDAFNVVTRLNRQLGAPRDEEQPVSDRMSVAAVLARTLSVPYVEVVADGVTSSVVGSRPEDRELHVVPLTYGDDALGEIRVSSRRAGVRLSGEELALLRDLADQLAIGMYAVRMSEEVSASRTALVAAREEERRRIRRDLHDGLGPTLASLRLQLAAAQRLLATEPDEAAAILADVSGQMNQTTAEIRRLVYGLRPPLLDELGLVAAIRNHPAALSSIELDVQPDVLVPLPAAVEVAFYRIATEAIHNVVRHSGGRHARIAFDIDDRHATMSVSDDGRGLPEPFVAGVGVSAIRERAAEVGGTAEWQANPGGGVTVTTTVPLEGTLHA